MTMRIVMVGADAPGGLGRVGWGMRDMWVHGARRGQAVGSGGSGVAGVAGETTGSWYGRYESDGS